MSERIRKAGKRYQIELFGAMAAYTAALIGGLVIAKGVENELLLTLLALAPIAPLIFAVAAFFRFYQHMDELQKRTSADAAALTLALTILVAITLGFLRRFGVFDFEDDMMWFGPFMIATWGAVRFFLGDRC